MIELVPENAEELPRKSSDDVGLMSHNRIKKPGLKEDPGFFCFILRLKLE